MLRNGDYAAAASAYEILLTSAEAAPVSAQAAFGLGRALLLDSRAEAAAVALASAAQDVAYADAHPEVFYWLGRAHSRAGQATQAAEAFAAYAERRPILAARAYQATGNAYAAVQDTANAIANYERAIAAAADLPSTLRAREGIAAAHTQAGSHAAAATQYQAILGEARNPSYRAEMLYLLGQAQLAAGQTDAGYASLQDAARADPKSSYAYQAVAALVNAGQPIDDLLRGRVDLNAGANLPAIAALNHYIENNPSHTGEPHALAAKAYEAEGDFARADEEWRQIIETHPGDAFTGEAWLGRGRSLWRLGDTSAARQVYLQGAENNVDAKAAAEALWWAAFLAERDDDLISAGNDYLRLAETFPTSSYASRARFRAGLSAYRQGDYTRAREVWTAGATAGRESWHAAADFWLGKALMAENNPTAAVEHWRGVAQRWGADNHYGVRAAQAVAEQTGEHIFAAAAASDDGSLAALTAWLQTWAGASSTLDLEAPRPEFATPTELHRSGETAAARDGFEALRSQWQDDPIALIQLALHARSLGYYDTSIRAAARAATLSTKPLISIPIALQQLMFPRHYQDLIEPGAARYTIDPNVFYALVRQESLFGSVATSTAAARGLTQVIPSTGRSIAEQLNWPNYSDDLLYRPYVSIAFGAFYLGQGLQGAGGNVWQALAGYNGGPGNAGRWRRLSGPDDDLFLEMVGFDETQAYLRAINVQSEHYRRLYAGD